MPPTDPPIDVTDILAQPREFAQRLARVERERAELIETVARLRAECDLTEVSFVEMRDKRDKTRLERDAARAEVARLRAALETYAEAREMVLKALPAVAINETEEIWGASNTALVRKALSFLWHCGALRQPAPAQPLDDDGVCKCGHARGQHRGVCMIFPCKCMEFTAPAHDGDA